MKQGENQVRIAENPIYELNYDNIKSMDDVVFAIKLLGLTFKGYNPLYTSEQGGKLLIKKKLK